MCSYLPDCGDFEKEEAMSSETRERIDQYLCEEKDKEESL